MPLAVCFGLRFKFQCLSKKKSQKQRVSVSLCLLSTMQHSATVTLLFLYSVCCGCCFVVVVLFTVGVNQHFSVFHRSLVCCFFQGANASSIIIPFQHQQESIRLLIVYGFVYVCVSTPFFAMAFNMKFV